MWISKRKWNEMCEKIDGLERANIRTCKEIYSLKRLSQGLIYGTRIVYNHEVDCVSTKDITDITLEELAKLVIDGTPIVREEVSKVKKEYVMRGGK